jgi:SRSO17 transposase
MNDGSKSLPLDIELAHHGDSLPKGKQDPLSENKPELGIKLIHLTLSRGYQSGIVIIDAGYGHNTSFLLKIENRN